MSIAIAITVTNSALSATTLPARAGATTASTMATGDKAITDLAEVVRQKVVQLLQLADPGANVHTTVTATVT